jgi:hypothetical protein
MPSPLAKLAPLARAAMRADSRARRMILAVAVYVVAAGVFAIVAGPQRLWQHTPYNHYALLADAWLHGRQYLLHGAPAYAGNNDFAEFQGKTYISFPPFPAALMLPFVALSGSPEDFRDGQFVIWLAGITPAVLFLVLEKLRHTGRSPRTETENLVLAGLFAFGTVYFFTAVEGTVWYAENAIGAALAAFFFLWALEAQIPVLAGLAIGLAYLTRPPVAGLSVFFALEAYRVSSTGGRLDARAFLRRCGIFAAPIAASLAIVTWMNWSRYGRATPLYFDHQFLTVGWHDRMLKWGLFGYHYLAKNLGVALTSLPWLPPPQHAGGGAAAFGAPFKVNEHGLALWFTTPIYFWLLWPSRLDAHPERRWLTFAVAVAAALPVIADLLYQNPGWRQFGYRFSNDFAVPLFVLLAVGGRPMRWTFGAAAAWGVAWNLFGAVTFDKSQFDRFYFRDGSQTIVFQPD